MATPKIFELFFQKWRVSCKRVICQFWLQHLPLQFLLSCFISSVKPHISHEVQALQPLSLKQAIGLVKIKEDRYSKQNHILLILQVANIMHLYLFSHFPQEYIITNHSKAYLLSNNPYELRAHRDKSLCYTCGEKFFSSHKCRSHFFLVVH